ncbi:MAG: transcriptional regulator [Candidatus Bathyarchaeia archaeon]
MKTFIKCEMCNARIPTDSCVFATYEKVIDGKEYVFCCAHCAEAFERSEKR